MHVALFHLADAYNLQVVLKFLENLSTPGLLQWMEQQHLQGILSSTQVSFSANVASIVPPEAHVLLLILCSC
jgi:hypothetical protein